MTDPKTIDPTDPVAVLRAAAQELEARRDDPRFVINMDDYHVASTTPCRICLAGAVMCGLAGEENMFDPFLNTSKFGKDWGDAFKALDRFRRGHVDEFFDYLYVDFDTTSKAFERFNGKWSFQGELSSQEIDELIGHCHTVADWLEDQGRKDNE